MSRWENYRIVLKDNLLCWENMEVFFWILAVSIFTYYIGYTCSVSAGVQKDNVHSHTGLEFWSIATDAHQTKKVGRFGHFYGRTNGAIWAPTETLTKCMLGFRGHK